MFRLSFSVADKQRRMRKCSRQWQQLPAAQFMAVFGPYASRIDEVLARYDPALLTAASQATADEAQVPLRPEERST